MTSPGARDPITILALIPKRERCGVTDYANQLYSADAFPKERATLIRRDLTVLNCLAAPFSGADVIHIQHEYSIYGFAGVWGFLMLCYFGLFRVFGLTLAVTVHTVYDWKNAGAIFAHRTQSRLLLSILSLYGQIYHHLLTATARRLIFLSEASQAKFLGVMKSANPARLAVIPIGFYDLPIRANDTRALEQRYAIKADDFVLTLFGFAFPNKGYHLGIEAVNLLHREHPEIKLLIVSGEPAEGGAQYLDSLKQTVGRLKLDSRVVFTGYIPGEDPLFGEVLLRSDCFLYPYLNESATSGSLATTLSARKIYITSDLEMFRAFTPGMKFRAGEAAELARAILQVRQMDPATRNHYREQLELYLANNNTNAMRKRHVELFRSLKF